MVLFGNSLKAKKIYARESCQRFQHQVKALAADTIMLQTYHSIANQG